MLLLAKFFSRIKKKCKRKLYYNFDQYNNVYHFFIFKKIIVKKRK